MEIILLERIKGLGLTGDVVNVKNGYAKNFLIPKGKAARANEANKKEMAERKHELEAWHLGKLQEAKAIAEKIGDIAITIIRQAGETGHLYGSVNSRDIAEGLKNNGVIVERGQVVPHYTIKDLGIHIASLELHPELTIPVLVNVARSDEDAVRQLTAYKKNTKKMIEPEDEIILDAVSTALEENKA